MRLIQPCTLMVAIMVWSSFGTESTFAQKLAIPQTPPVPSAPLTNVISENSEIVRIPLNALRIEIDDENQPFRLVNLDKRFEALALAKFLSAYAEKSRHVTIIVTSKTKRIVAGENEFLEQLGSAKKALIVHMPSPTGFDPDAHLREFAATYLTDSNPTQIPDPRTKR